MLKDERRNMIVKFVEEEKSISSLELSTRLKVTQETIRRDLEYLDSKSMIKKTFGGAMSLDTKINNSEDPSFNLRQISFLEEKNRIARHAITLLEENDTIAIDPSTTTLQMIKYLPEDKNITVITNSLSALFELYKKKNITTISVGGQLRRTSTSFLGYLSINNLSQFNINKVFLSGNSISIKRGLMDPNIQEVDFKNTLLQDVDNAILIANSTKFNKLSTFTVCPVTKFNTIITDNELDDKTYADLMALNIDVQKV